MDKISDLIIKLPELGEGVTEGELIKWLVSEGEMIQADQPVAEVMTDKASMEVPSPFDGRVKSFSAGEGDTIQVGQSLLVVASSDGKSVPVNQGKDEAMASSPPASSVSSFQSVTSEDKAASAAVLKSLHPVHPLLDPKTNRTGEEVLVDDSSILATHSVRLLALQSGVNLSKIRGSGLPGRITKEDIMKHSPRGEVNEESVGEARVSGSHVQPSAALSKSRAQPSAALSKSRAQPSAALSKSRAQSSTALSGSHAQPSAALSLPVHKVGFSVPIEDHQERRPLKGVRKKIAEKMQLSKQVIPHFTLLESANVEQLDKIKNSVKEMLKEKGIKVTYLSIVMKALLRTVKEFPELKAGINDFSNEIVIKNYYNFGFAVDTPRGLLVPVVKEVDKKSLSEVSFDIQTLADKARTGSIALEDMSGGTLTVTNIGSLGGEHATPIINAPEVAILGMYRLYIKPYWDGSAFQPGKTMNFSLTCDHRLIDGAVSARVLKFFIHKMENPLNLFI